MQADAIFRTFTACPTDVRTLVLDVRDYNKQFKHKHVIGAYCIRLSANGKVLLVRRAGEAGGRMGGRRWWPFLTALLCAASFPASLCILSAPHGPAVAFPCSTFYPFK